MPTTLSNMTILEAIRTDQAVIGALKDLPALAMTVGQAMELYPSIQNGFLELPRNAITPGIAEGDQGFRVGVYGFSHSNVGVYGQSDDNVGVYGKGGRLAGYFQGDVEVTGDIRLTGAADCAEGFDISDALTVEPGTVMVLGDEGVLQPSREAYDKRVAGVISGAGNYRPGIVLDDRQPATNRKPVALLGKVYCKVDAQYGTIEVGDLLTTSPPRGMQ
ncbi:MAG TPA: hypothetical protein VH640_12550 [Bryobacteraceae bacterium]|jgi:hypothetical protein